MSLEAVASFSKTDLFNRLKSKGLSQKNSESYFHVLHLFLTAQCTKVTFENMLRKVLPSDKISVHNELVRYILHRAQSKKSSGLPELPDVMPPKEVKKKNVALINKSKPSFLSENQQTPKKKSILGKEDSVAAVAAANRSLGIGRMGSKGYLGSLGSNLSNSEASNSVLAKASRKEDGKFKTKASPTNLTLVSPAVSQDQAHEPLKSDQPKLNQDEVSGLAPGADASQQKSIDKAKDDQSSVAGNVKVEKNRKGKDSASKAKQNEKATEIANQKIAKQAPPKSKNDTKPIGQIFPGSKSSTGTLSSIVTSIQAYSGMAFYPVQQGQSMDLDLFFKVRSRVKKIATDDFFLQNIRDDAVALIVHALESHVKNMIEKTVASTRRRKLKGPEISRLSPYNFLLTGSYDPSIYGDEYVVDMTRLSLLLC